MILDPLTSETNSKPFQVCKENDLLLFNYAAGKLDVDATKEVELLIQSTEWNEYYLDMKILYDTYGEKGLEIASTMFSTKVNVESLRAFNKKKGMYEILGEVLFVLLLFGASVSTYHLFVSELYFNQRYVPLIFMWACLLAAGICARYTVIPSYTLKKKLSKIVLLFRFYGGESLPHKDMYRISKIVHDPNFQVTRKIIKYLIKIHGEKAADEYLERLKKEVL